MTAWWTWCRARLGVYGTAGVIAALAALYVHAALLPDRESELAQLQGRTSRAAPGIAREGVAHAAGSASQPLPQFPAAETLPDWLERIERAAAASGVVMARTEYAVSAEPATSLARYHISLPVKGRYGQVRAFVSALLETVPTLAVTGVDIKRESIGAADVDARLDVALYLRTERR